MSKELNYKKPNGGSIMKNKLFLSLSLLTAVFSAQASSVATYHPTQESWNAYKALRVSAAAAKTALNFKRALIVGAATPVVVTAGILANQVYTDSNIVEAAELAEQKANIQAGEQLAKFAVVNEYNKQVEANHAIYRKELTKFGRTQLALGRFATSAKSTVKANPKVSGAVAAAAVAGLGYLAYKKYTTPKTVQAAKNTPAQTTPVVAAPACKRFGAGYGKIKNRRK